jgi:cell division protein ZapA (FtsZ GTPase activity inhibitor)
MERYERTIQIFNRNLTLMINSSEEETLEKALILIEEKVDTFKKQYGVKDELYLQAMITLNLAVELIKEKSIYMQNQAHLGERIQQLSYMLNHSLNKIDSSNKST